LATNRDEPGLIPGLLRVHGDLSPYRGAGRRTTKACESAGAG
jgi:hypothetical protein